MVTPRPDATLEDILQDLTTRAKALWGEKRALEIGADLEATARRILALSSILPERDTEPGYFQ